MNKGAIGNEGVNAVNGVFNRMGYVRSFINSDDTIPIWDGQIMVYKDKERFSNDNFLFSLPLQVKAHEYNTDAFPKNYRHSIDINYLYFYLKDGGVIYFVVLVGPNQSKVYCQFLTKRKIEKILSKGKGSKLRSLKFEPFPSNFEDFIQNVTTLNLQRTHSIIPYEQAIKYKNAKWSIALSNFGQNVIAFEYLTTHPVDILVHIDNIPSPFYVGDGSARISKIIFPQNVKVSIGHTTYYTSWKCEYTNSGLDIQLGNSVFIKYDKKIKQLHINIAPTAESLLEAIHELSFINAINEHKQITINNWTIYFPSDLDNKEEWKRWQNALSFWKDVQILFDLLHISEPILNFQKLTDEDIKILNTLVRALLYNETVYSDAEKKSDHLQIAYISNIRILFFVRYISGNMYKLVDYSKCISAYYKNKNGEPKPASIYTQLFSGDILVSNIDWSNMLKSYIEVTNNNPEYFERAHWDVLSLLNWYDKNNNINVLNAASNLLEWLIATDNITTWNTVWHYNLLQIKVRRGLPLDTTDLDWLYEQDDLLESKNDLNDDQVMYERIAIQVLINNAAKAKRLYHKMDDKQKEYFSSLPIYYLYKKLT